MKIIPSFTGLIFTNTSQAQGFRKKVVIHQDGAMLGWSGGGSGAALLPDSFEVGAVPPDARPRTDGKWMAWIEGLRETWSCPICYCQERVSALQFDSPF